MALRIIIFSFTTVCPCVWKWMADIRNLFLSPCALCFDAGSVAIPNSAADLQASAYQSLLHQAFLGRDHGSTNPVSAFHAAS